MSPPNEALQRISRLYPLPEVWARLDALAVPVAPKEAATTKPIWPMRAWNARG